MENIWSADLKGDSGFLNVSELEKILSFPNYGD